MRRRNARPTLTRSFHCSTTNAAADCPVKPTGRKRMGAGKREALLRMLVRRSTALTVSGVATIGITVVVREAHSLSTAINAGLGAISG
jgi:hypothetical protein